LHGALGDRARLSLRKLLRDRKQHTGYAGWGADQIGRWVGAVSVLSRITGRDCGRHLKPKVAELIAAQDEDGLYYGSKTTGNATVDRRVWFGQGRAIWGLLHYVRLTGDRAARASLRKAIECTVAHRAVIKQFRPHWGDPNTTERINTGIESGLGAIAQLAGQMRNEAWLAWGRYVADGMPRRIAPPGPLKPGVESPEEYDSPTGVDYGHHTHSYLSISHGGVDLAVATGDAEYLAQAQKVFDDTLPSVWITGGIPEGFGRVFEYRDETCSTVDWMILSLKLYRATGEMRYLDAAELTALNQLLSGQDHGGGFTHGRSISRHAWKSKDNHGHVHQLCCSMHGAIGLALAAAHAITRSRSGLGVNLPLDVDVTFFRSAKETTVRQRIDIRDGSMVQRIRVRNGSKQPQRLRLRVPYWSDRPSLRVNGRSAEMAVRQGFASVACAADAETDVELTLPMKLVVVPPRTNVFRMKDQPASGRAAEPGLQYGPFVLMLYREMFPRYRTRIFPVTVHRDAAGRPSVTPARPAGWSRGSIDLFVRATAGRSKAVLLTPVANATMQRFTRPDPLVARFRAVTVKTEPQ
jgi:DUF1680 family protein